MFMYTSSRGKSNCCHSKSEFQMFSLISGCHIGTVTQAAPNEYTEEYSWRSSLEATQPGASYNRDFIKCKEDHRSYRRNFCSCEKKA